MNSRLIGVLLGFSLSLHAFTLQSATLSVVPGTGNDCSDGEGSFQECLDIAENNGQGDTIEVQSGEYNLSATLSYVASVTENFPITVQNAGAELPVLSSGLTAQCLIFETGTLADDAAADVTVSGLVFQQCKNPGEDGGALAIYTDKGDIVVSGATFNQNESGEDGGALDINAGINLGSASVSIVDCVFTGNEALIDGAFSVAVAGSGSLEFRNNQVLENRSTEGNSGGGGLFADIGAFTVSGNLISGNEAVREGGGLGIGSGASTITVTNNIVAGNQAGEAGGGLQVGIFGTDGSLTLTNNTIFGNTTLAEGGGLSLRQDLASNHADIFNNIIFGNQASLEGDDIFSDEDFFDDGGTSTVNLFNNIFDAGGFFSVCLDNPPCTTVHGADSPTNLLEDPLLVNPAGGDFEPGENSPAIGAGDPAAPGMPNTDFFGNPRPTVAGGDPDIGAVQFQAEPTPTPTPSPTDDPELEGDGGCSLSSQPLPTPRGLLSIGAFSLLAALAARRRILNKML